jgi:hypothetical protein
LPVACVNCVSASYTRSGVLSDSPRNTPPQNGAVRAADTASAFGISFVFSESVPGATISPEQAVRTAKETTRAGSMAYLVMAMGETALRSS